ncbi:hypothetical protein L1049_019106 [Liquidambar formosana]|uniref:Mitochondrial GTPase 1 n=1 Tax=Liquidambar formosana TaxID=63359 RepID=A0AAP0RBZ1_LIQFO
MATATIARRLGAAVTKMAGNKAAGWYTPHMAAASRAIAERISLVDLILEIRDAREWMRYFEQQNCIVYGVNSHNKENIKEIGSHPNIYVLDTPGVLPPEIPDVEVCSKLALTGKGYTINIFPLHGYMSNSISPIPGPTQWVVLLRQAAWATHPYGGVLVGEIIYIPKIFSNLSSNAGAIRDCMVGEKELAQIFLAILNLSDEYKKWAKFSVNENDISSIDNKAGCSGSSELNMKHKKQYPTDHTQDFIVNDVRRTLFEAVSSFDGVLEDEKDMLRLIEVQFTALRDALHVHEDLDLDAHKKVATKLLNLYRTGRLGHYILDTVPRNA